MMMSIMTSKRPAVLFDGSIFSIQQKGGVSRCAENLLNQLAVDRRVQPVVHTDIWLKCMPLLNPDVTVWRDYPGKPWRVWNGLNAWKLQVLTTIRRIRLFHALWLAAPPLSGMKTVVTVYDMIHEKHSGLMQDHETQALKAAVIRKADYVIAISEQTKIDVMSFLDIPGKKVRVIYPGVGLTQGLGARSKPVSDMPTPYWLHVGCRNRYKNFSVLAEAFSQIALKTDSRLLLVGGETEIDADSERFFNAMGCRDRVILLGHIDDKALTQLYAGAVALVSCSIAEGFGLPLLEAMASGVPVVASDIPVFHEVLGAAGIYCQPHDPVDVRMGLLKTLDPATREKHIAIGLRQAALFSWDKAASLHETLYQELLGDSI